MDNIAERLKKLGVTDIFFCAGARNRKLYPKLSEIKFHHNFDERSASFKALGLSKSTGKPVAICTTSGSAVLECLPALAEAYYTNTKLILISADRTPDHAGTGFAQTIDQTSPAAPFCRTQKSQHIDSKIDLTGSLYPLHINIYTDLTAAQDNSHADFLTHERSIVLFSGGAKEVQGQAIYDQIKSHTLHYIEPDSSIQRDSSKYEIHSDENLCSILRDKTIKQLIRVGRAPISKCWREINDGLHQDLKIFHLDPESMTRLTTGTPVSHDEIVTLTQKEETPLNCHDEHLNKLIDENPLSEMAAMHRLGKLISKDDLIFLGNSLTIRTWKMVSKRTTNIFANRGTNGIDGLISTAIGIAKGTSKTVYCILGDLSFFYDFSTLAFQIPSNLKIIVINNGGGRIFETITPSFKEIVCDHNIEIKGLLSGMNLNVTKVVDNEISKGVISNSHVIEIVPSNEQTMSFTNSWRELHA